MKRNFQNPMTGRWYYFEHGELIHNRKLTGEKREQMDYENKIENIIKKLT